MFWVIFEKGSKMGTVAQPPQKFPLKNIPKLIRVLYRQLIEQEGLINP